MSLVFSAIVPHSPLLLPKIAAKKTKASLAATHAALKELEGELYVMQPDVLFILSPHAPMTKEAFLINLSNNYRGDLEEFGETDTKLKFNSDIELVSKIREYADSHHEGVVNIISQPMLDYGASIPLYYLTRHLPNVKIVPISTSLLPAEDHFSFGQLLRHVAFESNKRIAIIASAELAHNFPLVLTAPKNVAAETFDNKITTILKQNQFSDILKLNPDVITAAQAINGYRILSILFGTLDQIEVNCKLLSYEHPLGIGFLIAQFNLI